MTVAVDTLIDNSRAIATTAATNLASLKGALNTFVGSQYPHTPSDYDYAKTGASQAYAFRQPTDMADSAVALTGLVYGVKLPEIPDWMGEEEFGSTGPGSALGVGRDNDSPYAKFLAFMETLFPSADDVSAIQSALTALVNNPPTLDSVVTASSGVTAANKTSSLADAAVLFSARGMPVPDTYASGAATHVQALHVERDYDRAIDKVADDVYDAQIIKAQLGGLSSLFSDLVSARMAAINQIGGYLDAYLAELRAPLDVADNYSRAELGLYENAVAERVAKLAVDDLVKAALINYFESVGSYQRGSQDFISRLAGVNVAARDFMTQAMADTGTMDMSAAQAYTEAYSRKAAAATSALGTILSSAVTSFV